MALYRFLFAPVLLAVATIIARSPPAPGAPPRPSEQHAAAAATSTAPVEPAALRHAGAARPIRAR